MIVQSQTFLNVLQPNFTKKKFWKLTQVSLLHVFTDLTVIKANFNSCLQNKSTLPVLSRYLALVSFHIGYTYC